MAEVCRSILNEEDFILNEINGSAALFHAAKNNLPRVVENLERQDFDFNITDDEDRTAVFYANQNHNMDVLCQLINCGAKFNLDEIDGRAALFHATKKDHAYPLLVENLESQGLDLNTIDDEGRTAVFYANQNNNMFTLCELIQAGADFNLDEIDGNSALFHAAKEDISVVVHQLYSNGLDLNVIDGKGKTAVFYAKESGGMFSIYDLIRCGAIFNIDEIDGRNALFDAVLSDMPELVKPLCDADLDLDIIIYNGKTAVRFANERQRLDVLCELIQRGAKFNLEDIDGKAALFHAAKANIEGVVKPLYDAGLDLNVTDNEDKTVVFYCNKHFLGTMDKVHEVLVNARDAYGRTPLFYAVRDDDTTKARRLIEKGGNLQLKDNCNVSIFSFFIENCISKSIEALQSLPSKLFKKEHEIKALIIAILEVVYCQAPLLSVSGSPRLLKSYAIFNKTNLLKTLAFAQHQCSLIFDADKAKKVDGILSMIRKNEIDVPLILSLLNELGANPDAADSDGNTALHYASILPFLGVTQASVIKICKKLREFGASFNTSNHQHLSPLLFCLSSLTWKVTNEDNNWQSSIEGLVEFCRFLLNNGCSITNRSGSNESIFHWIISHIQQGLELNEETSRKAVCQVMIDILKLVPPKEEAVRNAVNNMDTLLNSPLHLWASIALKSPQDYTSFVTRKHTFEGFLRIILGHLLECGAKLNPRNGKEQTPLHVCRTWTAVKLLFDAGAKPNDVDSSGHSPLLVAAKDENSSKKTDSFYADVIEDPENFWKIALEKGLDSWIADKQGESLLSVLIKSEAFVLTRALLKVACDENYATNDVKLSLLNVISKDESKHTHWKTNLVAVILESAKIPPRLSLDSAFHFCCSNIVKFGKFDKKAKDEQSKGKRRKAKDEQSKKTKKKKKTKDKKQKTKNKSKGKKKPNKRQKTNNQKRQKKKKKKQKTKKKKKKKKKKRQKTKDKKQKTKDKGKRRTIR
jgi:ankyrin repeat protein